MSEKAKQDLSTEEIIASCNNPVRVARAIDEEPGYLRIQLEQMLQKPQIPGSFGDLVKQSFGIINAQKEVSGGNVVPFARVRKLNNQRN